MLMPTITPLGTLPTAHPEVAAALKPSLRLVQSAAAILDQLPRSAAA